MPRGEHFQKVTDDEILEQFDRPEGERKILTAADVAKDLPVTDEAVRQRMHRIDALEKEELGGTTFWKKEGMQVFADGGLIVVREFNLFGFDIPYLGSGRFDHRSVPLLVFNLYATLFLVIMGLVFYTLNFITGSGVWALIGFLATVGALVGVIGEFMLLFWDMKEPWATIGGWMHRDGGPKE